ncbi:MAG: 6-phosphogluconolactonase [Desulfarculaceae bacterium]|nr:6-phosphogluconolactonase [Desulfarculaceae bacterium]MCF8048299.1 6-phosphogluconolactonase [Desulfarculaceae bacterium]MCF8064619.1 6-phosphogluconolactonase [Desulfarculaceae bacterium]MCF8096641.1 6-phosphogluconolactonase [Desulfarculaceae bacterium]MCF8123676.1 6-phosphogluconolactonase [Desulfarculaceae bacterium]
MRVEVFADHEALAQAAAAFIKDAAREAVEARGGFSLALAGGSTPLETYRLLGLDPGFPWGDTQLFWGDERCVSPDHPDSNRGAALGALGPPEALPQDNIHPIRGQLSAQEAAQDYAWRLKGFFVDLGRPAFDLALLGLGPDGHVASLFADSPGLAETDAWVVPVAAPVGVEPKVPRVSLSLWAINQARQVLLLVSGAAKAPVVARLRSGQAPDLPAARLRPQGELVLYLDRDAAGD